MKTRSFLKKSEWLPQEIWRIASKVIDDSNTFKTKDNLENKVLFITIPKYFNERIINKDVLKIYDSFVDYIIYKYLQFNDCYSDEPFLKFINISLEEKINYLINKILMSNKYVYFFINFEDEKLDKEGNTLLAIKKLFKKIEDINCISMSIFFSNRNIKSEELKFVSIMRTYTREEILHFKFKNINFTSNDFVLESSNSHLLRKQTNKELILLEKETASYINHLHHKPPEVSDFKKRLKKRLKKKKGE